MVYLTLGTAFADVDVLQQAIEGLAVLAVDVLVAVGPRVDLAALGGVAPHVRLEAWDQFTNAEAVLDAGVGSRLLPDEFSRDAVTAKVQALLANESDTIWQLNHGVYRPDLAVILNVPPRRCQRRTPPRRSERRMSGSRHCSDSRDLLLRWLPGRPPADPRTYRRMPTTSTTPRIGARVLLLDSAERVLLIHALDPEDWSVPDFIDTELGCQIG